MRLVCLAAMLLLSGAPACAATITQSIIEPYPEEENFGSITVFDPSLGQLTAVTQTLTGNLVFTPASASSHYVISTGPLLAPITEYASADIFASATVTDPVSLTAYTAPTPTFGLQYTLEFFDTAIVDGGVLTSIGSVTDSFIYTYAPATSAAPEPSSWLFLASGLAGAVCLSRRPTAGGNPQEQN